MLNFNRLSTRARLYLMLLVPLLGLTYFAVSGALDNFRVAREATRLQSMMKISVAASAAVHELQKERGMSAGFLASNGVKFANELHEQHEDFPDYIADEARAKTAELHAQAEAVAT